MTNLLDHGYIKLIETWGSDERIIEAARQSTDGSFRGWGPACECTQDNGGETFRVGCPLHRHDNPVPQGDEKLLAYLYKNQHSTPFEMAGAVIEVQAPIFVFREWHRHRTQSYNELSARYTPLPDLYYMPTLNRCMIDAQGSNKQAGRTKESEELTEHHATVFREQLENLYADCEHFYQWSLKKGVPKELARATMPVGHYSRMRASANLRNWLSFLTLRQAPNAQWEIRQYANALNLILQERFPRTMSLFNED